MPSKPIGSIDGISETSAVEASLIHSLDHQHPSPTQVALAAAQAKEEETTEQRAQDGDPIAVIQLAKEEKRHTPVASQHVGGTPAEHPAGAHEPGKGDLIDIYD